MMIYGVLAKTQEGKNRLSFFSETILLFEEEGIAQ